MADWLAAVLRRPRIAARYGITEADSADLLTLLRDRAALAPVAGEVRLCRDPHDDVLIETALSGRAQVCVSRDDDLKGDSELLLRVGSNARQTFEKKLTKTVLSDQVFNLIEGLLT